jgi:hypothetical protein
LKVVRASRRVGGGDSCDDDCRPLFLPKKSRRSHHRITGDGVSALRDETAVIDYIVPSPALVVVNHSEFAKIAIRRGSKCVYSFFAD